MEVDPQICYRLGQAVEHQEPGVLPELMIHLKVEKVTRYRAESIETVNWASNDTHYDHGGDDMPLKARGIIVSPGREKMFGEFGSVLSTIKSESRCPAGQ